MAGAVAITLIALAAFDFAAVSTMRGYLVRATSSNLQQALTTAAPQLTALLPAVAIRSATDRPLSVHSVVGEYSVVYRPVNGQWVILQNGADVSAVALVGSRLTHAQIPFTTAVTYTAVSPGALVAARRAPGGVLLAGASLDQVNRTVGRIVLIVVLGSVAAVLLIGLGVFWLLRRGLRPIEAMAAQADRITAGDLTDRVRAHSPRSEVGRLGTALNGMLARIQATMHEREASQNQMRRFFADASHELRTPLASLRANAELYQQGVLGMPGQVDEVMRRITLETQRMSRLVDDMLRLARLGLHPDRCHEPVDLTALVRACAERARAAGPWRVWRVRVAEGLTVTGDEELLRRAVDNLLTNVLVHTSAGAVGTITASAAGDLAAIEVSDDGPGVPPDMLPHIFERFYRAGAAPTRPGSGLGLAIAAEVTAAHGGTAHAAPAEPHGLCVTLALPVRHQAAQPGSDRTPKSNKS
jgi:two-component system OmpR family sensor kinase